MNTEHDISEASDGAAADRVPLGYWLRVVDHLLTREVDAAFAAEGASRRDWMLLNALSGQDDMPAHKLAHRGRRLGEFIERGWVAETDDGWELTDEGRAAHERLGVLIDRVRERVAGAVSPDDYAIMTASLEAIARELGWDEDEGMPRGRGFGRGHGFGPGFGRGFEQGFGPGFGRGFGPGFGRGFAPGYGFGPWGGYGPWGGFAPGFGPGGRFERGFGPHAHHEHHRGRHPGKDAGRAHRRTERAYARGFKAGFDAADRGEKRQPEASDAT